MPIPDDEQFEVYLKQFRPVAADPLPMAQPAHRTRWSGLLGTWVATAAAILLIGTLASHVHSNRNPVTNAVENIPKPAHLVGEGPLTLRVANGLLAEAPSFKAAVDQMAFHRQNSPLPKGKQSALAVLGKEKIKL